MSQLFKNTYKRLRANLKIFNIFLIGVVFGILIEITISIYFSHIKTGSAVMPIKLINLNQLAEKNLETKLSDSEISRLVTTPVFDISLVRINQDIKLHRHIEDHILIIISGKAKVTGNDGQKISIGPGWYAQIPRGTPHSLVKDGDEPLIILQIASPPFNPDLIEWLKK